MSQTKKIVKVVQASVVSLYKINVDQVMSDIYNDKYNLKPNFLSLEERKFENYQSSESLKNRLISSDSIFKLSSDGNIREIIQIPCENKTDKFRCYYCRLKYTGERLGIVVDITSSNEVIEYHCIDKMICSGSCLLLYIDYISIPENKKEKYLRLTKQMLMDLFGKDNFPVHKDFRQLKENGGCEDKSRWKDESICYKKISDPIIKIKTSQYEIIKQNY
jgi:hypothetical protein